MPRRATRALLLVVLAQCAHSVEEYVTRLYDVFAPARFVSGLFTDSLPVGFAFANATLVAFGVWCWAVPARRRWSFAATLAWGWALLELANGTGHLLLALGRGGYFPGAATAPLLVAAGAWLAVTLRRDDRRIDGDAAR